MPFSSVYDDERAGPRRSRQGTSGDGVATAAPPAPSPSAQREQDPDEAAADRAASERERIEDKLDLSNAGPEAARRQLDQHQIARLQEELHRTHARLRRVQGENDRLRANEWRSRHQAKEEVRREKQREIDRLAGQVEDLKDDKRALEDDKRYRELERSFEERFGQADTSFSKELLGMIKQHGPDVLPEFGRQLMTFMKQAGQSGSDQPASALPSTQQLQNIVQQAKARQNAQNGSDGAPGPAPRPNPHEPLQQQQPPVQPTPQPQEPPAPTSDEDLPPGHEAARDPQSAFVEEAAHLALAELERDGGPQPAALAEEVRGLIAWLADELGFEPQAPAFAALTERLVPTLATEPAVPPNVAAQLLAPFTADLPGGIITGFKMLDAAKVKAAFIDPRGLDFRGHDEYLLDVLRALQSELS